LEEAIEKLDDALAKYKADLQEPGFVELYQTIQRERAFVLTDIGSMQTALPILEEVDLADPHDRWTLFYLGTCYFYSKKYAEAQEKIEESIRLGLPPEFAGRAHCTLGAACYELKDYRRARIELEKVIETAPPRYIKQAGMWRWLEYTCICLGLKAEAEHYAKLARPS